MIITRIKHPLSQYLQIFRNIRKKCRAPQVQFRFILDERQHVPLGLFIIDVRKTFIEKPDQTIPIQRIPFPDKSGIDQPRLQMRQIDRRPFCKIDVIFLRFPNFSNIHTFRHNIQANGYYPPSNH